MIKQKLFIQSIFVIFVFLFSNCSTQKEIELKYPVTKKVNQVDDYFGTKVEDPYRWLESEKDTLVKEWVQKQNEVTFSYLEQIPYREKIRNRINEIYNYPRYSSPNKIGKNYIFSKNDGLQNQSVYYIQNGIDGEPEVLLDPNKMSEDGTISVRLSGYSNDDKYIAYLKSEAGSDWRDIRVIELETKKILEDHLKWIKFSGVSWSGNGFFYSCYDEPEEGTELTAKNEFCKVYYHKLGEPQSKDKLIYEDKKHPLRYFYAYTTEDQNYLILNVSQGTYGNEVHYKNLKKKNANFVPLFTGFKNEHSVIDNIDDKFLALTDLNASTKKIILVDPKQNEPKKWKSIINQTKETIEDANLVGGKLFVSYLKDVASHVYQYDLNGKLEKEIELPGIGSASGFSGKRKDETLFYTFTSFTYPPTIYKYDIKSGKSEVFRKSEVKFNPDDYITNQVFYTSKDGTKIPMFITYKKDLKLNGDNPTYLYAYGGFNANMTPYFSTSKLIILENNGIYAIANLRGGGEYGEDWHKAGMLFNKQNVFDDFIAAAEYLIEKKYTSKEKLAIAGASNGGLLIGACMTQRPDLFKVALPAVGVMDMLRYHKFTIGHAWAVEYGSSDEEEHFKNLYAYSPLHNIKKGENYPATLVTTSDHDDRVVPAHSFKFISTLQENHQGKNPVLIRIETRSGHGSSNLTKAIDRIADEYAFMFYNMGIKNLY